MNIKIISEKDVTKGKLIRVKAKAKSLDLLFTWHVLDSIKDYGFSVKDVMDFLLFPEEVVKGHVNRFIAHKRINKYLARVVYEYAEALPVVITFYIADVNRYSKGKGYENKILP